MSMYTIDVREAVRVPHGTVTVSGLDHAIDVAEKRLALIQCDISLALQALRAARKDRRCAMGAYHIGFLRRRRDAPRKTPTGCLAAAKVAGG